MNDTLRAPRRAPLTIAAVAAAMVLMPATAFADETAPDDTGVVVVDASTEPASAASAPEESAPTEPEAPAESVAPAPVESVAPAPAEPVSPETTEPVSPETTEPAPDDSPADAPVVSVVDAASTTPAEVFAGEPIAPTVTLFTESAAEAAALPVAGDPCYPAVCIDNGTILLAVNPTGELNASDGEGSKAGSGDVGLEYLPTGNDSTSPGCLCEGWGVADSAAGVSGSADVNRYGPGGENLELESFEYTDSTATSVVLVRDAESNPHFRVTHEFVPSAATPNLYQVNVTIENLSGDTIATVQYRRVMDWDVEPTAFDEYVTIDRGSASAITYTSDDGFASTDPLDAPTSILFEGEAVDSGPYDHGALFDFAFGSLGAGESLSFVIFYGAAASEADAKATLGAVGAEAYSFGQTSSDPTGGTPNTFIFAFGNVGGAPIFEAPEEPAPGGSEVPAPGGQEEPPAGEEQPAAAPATGSGAVTVQPALAATGGNGVHSGIMLVALMGLAGGLVLTVTARVRRRH